MYNYHYLPLFHHLDKVKPIATQFVVPWPIGPIQTSCSFHCAREYSGMVMQCCNLAHMISPDRQTNKLIDAGKISRGAFCMGMCMQREWAIVNTTVHSMHTILHYVAMVLL